MLLQKYNFIPYNKTLKVYFSNLNYLKISKFYYAIMTNQSNIATGINFQYMHK